MSASESDGYESADEKLNSHKPHQFKVLRTHVNPKRYKSIGSDSDDDEDYIPSVPYQNQQNQYKAGPNKITNKSGKISHIYSMPSFLTDNIIIFPFFFTCFIYNQLTVQWSQK